MRNVSTSWTIIRFSGRAVLHGVNIYG